MVDQEQMLQTRERFMQGFLRFSAVSSALIAVVLLLMAAFLL